MKWELSNTQKELLALTATAIFGAESVKAGGEALIREACDQAILPLVYALLPQESKALSSKEYKQTMAANMAISYEHTELHDLLTENGIPYVILKGAASASYYPSPILRTMGDVDFLVKEQDLKRAGELLEGIGFQPEEDTGGIHIAYHREGSTWEMHRSINGIPDNPAGEIIRGYLSDLTETAVDYDEGNGILRIPDDFHHGLILLLHTASHLTSEGVGLRHLCDWAVFVNHFTDTQFVALFESRLKACGLWRFAQLLTLVSVKYLHLPEKDWAGDAEEELLEGMICDILSGGNFGKKDEDRYRQIKYISNRGEHTVDEKSAVHQLWETVSRKAKAEHKTKLRVLTDYARLVLQGKRKLDDLKTIRRAEGRKELYTEFRLYERTSEGNLE